MIWIEQETRQAADVVQEKESAGKNIWVTGQ